MSWVKMDCQTAARRRAAGMELPMMSRKVNSNARWIWRKQAKVWRGAGAGREAKTFDAEKVPPVREEAVVEAPAAGGGGGGAEAGVIKVGVVAGIEKIEDGVLIEHQIRLARAGRLREAGAQLFREGFEFGGE